MWPLYDKNAHNRILFWCKLLSLVCILHAAILFYLLIFHRNSLPLHLTFSQQLLSSDRPVIFLPLRKTVAADTSAVNTTIASQPDAASKKEKLAQTAQAIAKPELKKAASPKPEEKKSPELKKDQVVEKKPEEQKMVQPDLAKQETKKPAVEEKKSEELTKKIEDKSVEKNEKPKQAVEPKKIQPEQLVKKEPVSKPKEEKSVPLYVGQQELQALQLHEQLAQEVSHHWRVPPGLSAQLACDIALTVSKSGAIERVRVIKGSGVLMYDIAARTSITRMKMPRLAWGKEIVITFKQ